jgi:hypothetical protein
MAKQQAPARVTTRVTLPEPLYDHYAERAVKCGRTVEEELGLRLERAKYHVADSPIYFDDAQRRELSELSGKLLRSPEDVINWLKPLVSLSIGHVSVPLDDRLLKRLASRQFGHSWEEHIRHTVTEALESFVGMR